MPPAPRTFHRGALLAGRGLGLHGAATPSGAGCAPEGCLLAVGVEGRLAGSRVPTGPEGISWPVRLAAGREGGGGATSEMALMPVWSLSEVPAGLLALRVWQVVLPWCRRRRGCSAGDLGIPRLDAAGPSRGLGRGQRASRGGGVGAGPEPCPAPGLEQGGHPSSGRPGGSRGPGWQLPVLVQAPWGGWPHAGVWGGWRSRGHRGQGGGSKVSAGPSRGGGRDAQGRPELDLDPGSSGRSLPSPTASARALGAQLPGSVCCLCQGVAPAPLL